MSQRSLSPASTLAVSVYTSRRVPAFHLSSFTAAAAPSKQYTETSVFVRCMPCAFVISAIRLSPPLYACPWQVYDSGYIAYIYKNEARRLLQNSELDVVDVLELGENYCGNNILHIVLNRSRCHLQAFENLYGWLRTINSFALSCFSVSTQRFQVHNSPIRMCCFIYSFAPCLFWIDFDQGALWAVLHQWIEQNQFKSFENGFLNLFIIFLQIFYKKTFKVWVFIVFVIPCSECKHYLNAVISYTAVYL